MVGMENFAISASGPPDRRSAPELHPVEIGVSDGSCIRISETHNLGHYWLCYTHHSASRSEMVAEVGFEPTTTFWVVLAYETRELDRATLLRDE